MAEFVRAVFEHGSLVPETPFDLPEGARVLLTVHSSQLVVPPVVTAPEERTTILRETVERMKRNPLPAEARRFSRDQMHERG
jgi:predicted DNA-binding antitoxin AbrB/MazE fold protein